jgi:hypothetical protein
MYHLLRVIFGLTVARAAWRMRRSMGDSVARVKEKNVGVSAQGL